MSSRALCLWVILASLAALAWYTADPSALSSLVAGTACLAGAGLVFAADWRRGRR